MKTVLVVDDEENMLTVLEMLFQGAGFATATARDGISALAMVTGGRRFDVVVSDFKMGGMDGIELLRRLRELGFDLPFVLVTAYGTIEKAVEAMKLGAVDVVTKPFTSELILGIVNRVCRMEAIGRENQILREIFQDPELVYVGVRMSRIGELLRKIGPATTPVLITGESGTGKEVAARALHRAYAEEESRGAAASCPFVMVNCPAVPETLLESELFGYRRGAFTGAVKDFKGKVELAHGGTLFFDEIGDLPASTQPKLLRLLENKTYEPLGAGLPRAADVRVVCATNRNLKAMVREGRFREDLYYRINTITVDLPPLRDRREDIPALAQCFLERYRRELRKSIQSFEPGLIEELMAYDWPGNVRELKNVIERCVVLSSGSTISIQELPSEILAADGTWDTETGNGRSALDTAERRLIEEALGQAGGNVSEAARHLGISRNTMRYRLRKYGLKED